ncbi:MAG: tetratricopeptide repeat protein [Bacteroidota bacterium]
MKKLLVILIILFFKNFLFSQEIIQAGVYEVKGDEAFNNENYKEAILNYDNAINFRVDDFTYYLRGLSKFFLEDYQGAVIDLSKSISIFSKERDKSNKKGDKSDFWITGRYSKGINDSIEWAGIIQIEHKYSHAYYYRGIAKSILNDNMGAISDLNKSILINKNSQAYYYRGRAKQNLKKYQEAILDYNNAIKIDKGYKEAYFFRGLSKGNLKLTNEACLDLSKAGELGFSDAYEVIKDNCK